MTEETNISAMLEQLGRRLGCDCLSDLHRPNQISQALLSILEVEEDVFTIEQWNYALSYILNTKAVFSSVEDGKSVVSGYLREIK